MDQYVNYFDWTPSTPLLSDSSPISSTSSSPFLSSTPDLASCSIFPLSPPAPHRKAPRPPTYTPRRHRARHIQMREPARVGLFTVSETAEDEARAAAVLERSNLDDPGFSSSCTTEASESGCGTPGYESEDPFSFESMWRNERDSVLMADSDDDDVGLGLGIEMSRTFTSRPSSRSSPANRSSRRPPPLSLVSSRHPYQLPSPPTPSPSRCAAPKLNSSSLLPPLPIFPAPSNAQRNQPQSPRTPTRSRRPGRNQDLLLRFAELLESCGEDTSSATYGFPLPPARTTPAGYSYNTPTLLPSDLPFSTPSSAGSFEEPTTPRTPAHGRGTRRTPPPPPIKARWANDHSQKVSSWRQSQSQLDRSPPHSPAGSHSSTGSRKSLPKRAPIPWECKM